MCGGPSNEQRQMWDMQSSFYQMMQRQYETVFGEQQAILADLKTAFTPILQAGPNQHGFNEEQLSTLNSQAIKGTADQYQKAGAAVQNQIAAQSGGSDLPSGAAAQLEQQVAVNAAKQTSDQLAAIKEADYAQGYQNYQMAANVLGSTAGLYNPVGYAGAANQAGSAAGETANQITQANNAWMGMVGGVLGGVAGAATSYGLGKMK